MIGVAPATHELVLYGLIILGFVVVVGAVTVMVHTHMKHKSLLEEVKAQIGSLRTRL